MKAQRCWFGYVDKQVYIMGRSHQITSDGHRIAIGWTFYRMGSVPNSFNGWNLFLKDSINEHRFESFYAHFILFLLCCVIYFPLLTWHFQSSLNLISILSASDVCECCIVLYRNPFCPMAIQCPSDEKYFWCEGAIRHFVHMWYRHLSPSEFFSCPRSTVRPESP